MEQRDRKQWSDTQFEASLVTIDDAVWLSSLSDKPIDNDWLEQANRVIAKGSINLHFETEPETVRSVMNARLEFYGSLLGWDALEHPLNSTFLEFKDNALRTMPLATVIATQRVMYASGVDLAKILEANPIILEYGPDTVQTKIDFLVSKGLDIPKVVERLPSVFNIALDSLREKIDILEDRGIDPAQFYNRQATLFRYPARALAKKIDAFSALGIDGVSMSKRNPHFFGLSFEVANTRIEILRSYGIDPIKFVNSMPTILNLTPDLITLKMHTLDELGLRSAKMVKMSPKIFGLSDENIRSSVLKLCALGLTTAAVSNSPSLVGYKIETVAEKIEAMQRFGIDLETINKYPNILYGRLETLERKAQIISDYARKLKWQGDPAELIARYPALLLYVETKLKFAARLFAIIGKSDMLPSAIYSRVAMSPDASLVLLAEGKQVNRQNAQLLSKRLSTQERKLRADNISLDPALAGLLGTRLVAAYLDWSKR